MVSPAEQQFRILAVNVILHEPQQKRPHDVCVILQFTVKRYSQQRREIHFGPGVKIRTALQRSDKLHTHTQGDYSLQTLIK